MREKLVEVNGVFALYPAAQVDGDDIEIYADEARASVLMTWHNLRQQNHKPDRPRQPVPRRLRRAARRAGCATGSAHSRSAPAASSSASPSFEARDDDYNAIMLKVLADRLAEAFAERLHERVRREYWGYASDERLGNPELIAERYRGIRPAPGYPACPDHTAKGPLFRLLDAEKNAGMKLTESFAMLPASAVSGFYLSHPDVELLRGGQDRPRPGRGLRAARGHQHGRSRKVARALPRVRTRNRIIAAMGKGDKRTRKGKIYKGSYGKKRPQRVKKPKKT